MNTTGHRSVAEEAGLPLLKEAFRAHTGKEPHLGAFYMGNWLTDVSQLVDPVAYASAVGKLELAIDSLVEKICDTVFAKIEKNPGWVHLLTELGLHSVMNQVKNDLFAKVKFFALHKNDPRQSDLAE